MMFCSERKTKTMTSTSRLDGGAIRIFTFDLVEHLYFMQESYQK
jgi:hypothetical protein